MLSKFTEDVHRSIYLDDVGYRRHSSLEELRQRRVKTGTEYWGEAHRLVRGRPGRQRTSTGVARAGVRACMCVCVCVSGKMSIPSTAGLYVAGHHGRRARLLKTQFRVEYNNNYKNNNNNCNSNRNCSTENEMSWMKTSIQEDVELLRIKPAYRLWLLEAYSQTLARKWMRCTVMNDNTVKMTTRMTMRWKTWRRSSGQRTDRSMCKQTKMEMICERGTFWVYRWTDERRGHDEEQNRLEGRMIDAVNAGKVV